MDLPCRYRNFNSKASSQMLHRCKLLSVNKLIIFINQGAQREGFYITLYNSRFLLNVTINFYTVINGRAFLGYHYMMLYHVW